MQYEVVNDQLGAAFAKAAQEAGLRVAGQPSISEKEGGPVEGQLQFDATFEVYPEVTIGDLSAAEVERATAEVDDAAIDRTVEILRKQRRTFAPASRYRRRRRRRPRDHRLRRQDRRRAL